jgi:hypothetical protein
VLAWVAVHFQLILRFLTAIFNEEETLPATAATRRLMAAQPRNFPRKKRPTQILAFSAIPLSL